MDPLATLSAGRHRGSFSSLEECPSSPAQSHWAAGTSKLTQHKRIAKRAFQVVEPHPWQGPVWHPCGRQCPKVRYRWFSRQWIGHSVDLSQSSSCQAAMSALPPYCRSYRIVHRSQYAFLRNTCSRGLPVQRNHPIALHTYEPWPIPLRLLTW